MAQNRSLEDMRREERRHRSRLRLMGLLVIYPVYKMVDYFNEENLAWAIVMGFVSILYIIVLISLLAKR